MHPDGSIDANWSWLISPRPGPGAPPPLPGCTPVPAVAEKSPMIDTSAQLSQTGRAGQWIWTGRPLGRAGCLLVGDSFENVEPGGPAGGEGRRGDAEEGGHE